MGLMCFGAVRIGFSLCFSGGCWKGIATVENPMHGLFYKSVANDNRSHVI